MKKIFTMLLLAICFVTFCGCNNSPSPVTISPYKPQSIRPVGDVECKAYVCGAVRNEGYYHLKLGSTLKEAVYFAGFLPQTAYPLSADRYICSDTALVVNYMDNGVLYYAVNLNGAYVVDNLPVANVSAEVIAKLHRYYTTVGKITNKQKLKDILTADEYEQNYYKFYVDKQDFVQVV